jgi:hypothetical protein
LDSDIIQISKYKYTWLLKGCAITNFHLEKNPYYNSNEYQKSQQTYCLDFTYQEKFGSPLQSDIDSEIRDWKLKKGPIT